MWNTRLVHKCTSAPDTLSRVALPLRHARPDTPDYLIFQVKEEERSRQEIEETNMEEALFVTDQRLEKIRLKPAKMPACKL